VCSSGALASAAAVGARLAAVALEQPGSAWQRLEYLCGQMLAGVRAEPDYVLVILQAFTSEAAPERARAAVADYGQQTFADITGLIAQGQAEGSVAAGDPVELALAFTGCIQGIALGRMQNSSSEGPFPGPETVLRLLQARRK
jgi:hypothetical protein